MPKFRVTYTWDVVAKDPDEALAVLDVSHNEQENDVRPISLSVNEWLDGWNILRDQQEPLP